MIDETIIANMTGNVNKKHTVTARNYVESAFVLDFLPSDML